MTTGFDQGGHRTENGLRGPVHTCTEETIYCAETRPNGMELPERRFSSKYEYDPEGRLLNLSWNYGEGAWSMKRTYGPFGPVLEVKLKDDIPQGEISYEYSSDGRLQKTSDRSEALGRVRYSFDSEGRPALTTQHIGRQGQFETTYNEHDDPILTITKCSQQEPEEDTPRVTIYETAEAYTYDQAGNWTERVTSGRRSGDQDFKPSIIVRRTLTYF